MHYSQLVNTILLMACLTAGLALAQHAVTLPTVILDRSIHFTGPDGSDVEAPAGTYHVESAGESRLRLTSSDGGSTLLIQAQSTTHTEAVDSPVSITVATDEDSIHLALLMPHRTALDALGSMSAVRSRATLLPLPALQLKQATAVSSQRQARSVRPDAPWQSNRI